MYVQINTLIHVQVLYVVCIYGKYVISDVFCNYTNNMRRLI